MNKKLYLVYKITNLLDDKIYIGCHLAHNLSDRYMGSGVEIKQALKLHGKKSFKKEILFVFDNREQMLAKEKELVTKEFCQREDTYNRIEGGGVYVSNGMVTVQDKEGKYSKVYISDPRYLSGELIYINKGKLNVRDNNGNIFQTTMDDPKYISGDLVSIQKGVIIAKDKDGNVFRINKDDERWVSGELKGLKKGVYQPQWDRTGKPHSEKTKEKMRNIREERGLNAPEKNSQFGSYWITNGIENKKIKNSEIPEGWYKGRKLKNILVD